jgi:hypothetical protein
VRPRGYSLPLQRALSDFGAEESFGRAVQRLWEHYGITVPVSGVRQQTLAHAQACGALRPEPPQRPAQRLITEMDGTMLPVVTTVKGPGLDGRKGKHLDWREVRHCFARVPEAVSGRYGATLGSVEVAGLLWYQTALSAGLSPTTQVHGLGDGAPWIVRTFAEQFGAGPKASAAYTVDFHHVSDYLADAALVMAAQQHKAWLHTCQQELRESQVEAVLGRLAKAVEPPEQAEAPVRKAHGYIQERKGHMDYARALAADLPIGSGEIESGHKHVLQKRLKLAGAWWLETNLERMLQLRTLRANQLWDKYWSQIEKN